MRKGCVDRINDLNLDTVTLEDPQCRFFTGRAYVKSQIGRRKEYGYREGVMTPISNIQGKKVKECQKNGRVNF